jgi:anti-sigma factor RsiW
MTDCRRTLDRLAPYVDRQLAPAEHVELERHLRACGPCRAAALAEQGAQRVLRERAATLRSVDLPPGLRTRCEALAREHQAAAASRSWRARLALAYRRQSPRLAPASLSALLVLFTAAAIFSLATARSNTLLAAQLTADHAKCFRLFAGPGEPADPAELERMLQERYGWDLQLAGSSGAAEVELIGARRCLYADGTVPHVMYRVRGEDVSLYMLDGVTRSDARVTSLGHESRIWSRGTRTYVLVAPPAARDLDTGLRYVMQESR